MGESLFEQIFGCCLRPRPSSPSPERDPLLPPPGWIDIPTHDIPEPQTTQSEAETLAEIVGDAQSKIVDVLVPDPFALRPRQERSRSPSPHGSPSLTPDPSERSTSRNPFPPRMPVLETKLIKVYKGKLRSLPGEGRGRGRAKVRDTNGAPVENAQEEVEEEEAPPKLSTLARADDALLSSLSLDVQQALIDGFRLRDVGKVVLTWNDT